MRPAARVRQIELTLERLRWTPLLQGPRMIVINIPEFVLRAYEVQDGRISVRQTMKVIVGKALDTRTPLFDEDMRFIEFSPYWNVPPSIARDELVPRLRRDPATSRARASNSSAPTAVSTTLRRGLDAVLAGQLRMRQRPGPRNALGDIKFVFPNREATSTCTTRRRRNCSSATGATSATAASASRSRWTLAGFVLQGMPGWTEERIRAAMAQGKSSTLRLAEPVRVVIAYGTALVKDGRIYFFDDIYGQDRLLDAALRRASAALGPGPP